MSFFIGLILGIMIGWVLEWILDWWFWRGDLSDIGTAFAATAGSQDETRMTEEALNAPSSETVIADTDDLQKIQGVGRTYEKSLNDAGIYTFSALASATVEQIYEIVGQEHREDIDPQSWIEEARNFASTHEGNE